MARSGQLDLSQLYALDRLPEEIATLGHLEGISCFQTLIVDLGPLSGLTSLTSIDCRDTSVSDLGPLSGLTLLTSIACSYTSVSDLGPLSGLTSLTSIDCGSTSVSDLGPLSGLTSLTSIACSSTSVSDLGPLSGLTSLTSIDCSRTSVSDLGQLSGLTSLTSIDCGSTSVSDLGPLSGLTSLTSIACWNTPVSDLGPLSGLTSLTSIDCSFTSVSDLGPLSGLTSLTSIACSRTSVSDLGPLSRLTSLTSITCSFTSVSDLGPLSGLTSLTLIDCSGTSVSDLGPLSGLTSLTSIDCSRTSVSDLGPLSGLTSLTSITCSFTSVSDLGPLSGLTSLTSIACGGTSVSDLDPLSGLTSLTSVSASDLSLSPSTVFFDQIAAPGSRLEFYAANTSVSGIPVALLSEDEIDDCAPRLRAFLADLGPDGGVDWLDVPIMLLGNGKAGKSTLAGVLERADFDPIWDSTHGVRVRPARIDAERGETRLRLWDFGGQEIYHGTHALFLKENALFTIVWSRETETDTAVDPGGLLGRNHPLAYWVDLARLHGGRHGHLRIVQSKCAKPADDVRQLPLPEGLLDGFASVATASYCAATGRLKATAIGVVRSGVDEIHRTHPCRIGPGWLAALRAIERLIEEDAARPPDERRHRMLDRAAFEAICDAASAAGPISSPDHLLTFLDRIGLVLFREGLFEDRIVLDQAFLLDAVYAVFDRKNCVAGLRRAKGRFTRPDLDTWLWGPLGHSVEDQRFFVDMMRTCGVAFRLHAPYDTDPDDVVYVAPDHLPDAAAVAGEIAALWPEETVAEAGIIHRFDLFHRGLLRDAIAAIGNRAGIHAAYWRDGVVFYDLDTRAYGRMALTEEAGFTGTVTLASARRDGTGDAAALLERLEALFDRSVARFSLRPAESERSGIAKPAERSETGDRPPLQPGPVPKRPGERRVYVSYAWRDESGDWEGQVDALCETAGAEGFVIHRDKDRLRTGESIAAFMDELADGDLIYVFLSEKYVRSDYCMHELLQIFNTSARKPERFAQRILVFAVAGFRPADIGVRTGIAVEWRNKVADLEKLLADNGHDLTILGVEGYAELSRMKEFVGKTADLLRLAGDQIRPHSIADALEAGRRRLAELDGRA